MLGISLARCLLRALSPIPIRNPDPSTCLDAIFYANVLRSSSVHSGLHSRPHLPSIGSRLSRPLSSKSQNSIQAAIRDNPVVVFMKGTPDTPQCGFSRAVLQVLDLHDVPYTKIKTFNCLEDQELRQDIKEFSEWPTIPQVYIDGEFMGGCDTMIEMHRSGELSKVLEAKKIVKPPASARKSN
ncbi:hypothetical protein O181_083605 [Austropuccinia psidii MF-1]|uniref:Monothiol glutaredoxin-5, mitochondrial n=1 Tax=Austropuccinia psidii MF-1 TaxID=1389203 RepID=A0A9Q3FU21_9BASI|nr:hypothetical protein [Austropuccinia psidii MF-1]